MTFNKSTLVRYQKNDFDYIQKFAGYSFNNDRLSQEARDIILANENYGVQPDVSDDRYKKFKL